MKGTVNREKGRKFLSANNTCNKQVKTANQNAFYLLPFAFSLIILLLSCTRTPQNNETSFIDEEPKARPSAIIKTGEYPVWFLLTPSGPIHIDAIEDAVAICSFEPWPLALHIRFYHERNEELVMAVNRGGFLKITPQDSDLALYYFSGGSVWKKYTIGGFVNYNDQDTALLYLDDRFKESGESLPDPRTWSFNMESNSVIPVSIPALEVFPAYNGWDANILFRGSDNLWYFRVIKKLGSPDILYLRTENLSQAGIAVNADDFFNSIKQAEKADDSNMPALPAGFVYTGIFRTGNSIAAFWEEQKDFLIGAAGFMLIKEK